MKIIILEIMKANRILTLFSVFTTMLLVTTSCVEDDDYATPDISVVDPNITPNLTFLNVIARYNDAVADGDQVGVFDDENDTTLYIEGYVISSDRSGNFYEELIIQNKIDGSTSSEDPRLGLNISINVSSLSDTYEVGRKVYIKMNGLAIGEDNGVFVIGKANGNSLEQLQSYEYTNHVIRGAEVATLTPKIAAISELTEADENTLIQLDNMQFHRNSLSSTYAGEASDEFDGCRSLESCDDGSTILLQTSTFSDFKSVQIEQLKGSIQGIYTRDFGDDFSVLVVNSTGDISFNDPDRCDPDVLECDGPIGGTMTLFEQNFESTSNIAALEGLGWEHIMVDGNEDFFIGNFSGNNYAQISGFGGADVIETWLVTPDINLDASTNESFTFDLEVAYANGVILSVLITDAYTGDVATTEWTEVDVTIPNTPTSGFGGFNSVGDINISCLDGDVRIAFKYVGSDPSATTRYHLDNFEVTGN
jgi:hypothetical protein